MLLVHCCFYLGGHAPIGMCPPTAAERAANPSAVRIFSVPSLIWQRMSFCLAESTSLLHCRCLPALLLTSFQALWHRPCAGPDEGSRGCRPGLQRGHLWALQSIPPAGTEIPAHPAVRHLLAPNTYCQSGGKQRMHGEALQIWRHTQLPARDGASFSAHIITTFGSYTALFWGSGASSFEYTLQDACNAAPSLSLVLQLASATRLVHSCSA